MKQVGLVKAMHPANPAVGEPDDKVTFLTDGKTFKVKASNIVRMVSKKA